MSPPTSPTQSGSRPPPRGTGARHARPATGVPVALGLGANLADPPGAIRRAVARLCANGLTAPRLSPLYETEPLECDPGTPPFLNAALVGRWHGPAARLLALARRIERELGRPATHSRRAARVIDIDLLLFGGRVSNGPRLRLPHPRLAERQFVLAPLADIAPDWPIPPGDDTVASALRRLRRAGLGGRVRRLGTTNAARARSGRTAV